jgi:hypothetical protein
MLRHKEQEAAMLINSDFEIGYLIVVSALLGIVLFGVSS